MTKRFDFAMKAAQPDGTPNSSIVPDDYDLSSEDILELMRMARSGVSGDWFRAINLAFTFSFVMGNRATHARNLKRL